MEKFIDNRNTISEAINWIWGFNFSAAEKYFSADSTTSSIQAYYFGQVV